MSKLNLTFKTHKDPLKIIDIYIIRLSLKSQKCIRKWNLYYFVIVTYCCVHKCIISLIVSNYIYIWWRVAVLN